MNARYVSYIMVYSPGALLFSGHLGGSCLGVLLEERALVCWCSLAEFCNKILWAIRGVAPRTHVYKSIDLGLLACVCLWVLLRAIRAVRLIFIHECPFQSFLRVAGVGGFLKRSVRKFGSHAGVPTKIEWRMNNPRDTSSPAENWCLFKKIVFTVLIYLRTHAHETFN